MGKGSEPYDLFVFAINAEQTREKYVARLKKFFEIIGKDTEKKLTECAREVYNLGNIGAEVNVDGTPVSKLDVRMSQISGSLDYKINTLQNVSEIYTKGFNLTVPSDSNMPNLVPGERRAGSHGWWVFLEPLPPGKHTVSYNVRVLPTGALTSPGTNPTSADITYSLDVK